MTEMGSGQIWNGPAAAEDDSLMLRNAEAVYHDCLARFGHNSAEAYVARVFWNRLRARSRSDAT